MAIALLILLIFGIIVYIFLSQPKFGKLPKGDQLERIKNSENYRSGAFQNLSPTPDLTEGASYLGVMKEFLFGNKARMKPNGKIPSLKTDLHGLDRKQDVLVWFGHSSYFLHVEGRRILVDPVFSGSASPVPFGTRAFEGTDVYAPEDIPEIDFLMITHDHWDHLDYATIIALKPKIGKIVCGLGIGAHFLHWGFSPDQILERDWNESLDFDLDFKVHVLPARHFSGRGLSRNKALWVSFLLETAKMKIYLGGDSGYDSHFKRIGEKFGPIDLAILDNGQYDKSWKYVHMLPDEILLAAQDLDAARVLPVHSGKFVLSNHSWDEPLEKIVQNNAEVGLNLITPLIGEKVRLKDTTQEFSAWWREIN
ncbi:MBL fold metallo-hydrolase [Algoriphagus sp. A40]|uniref:MBL fold metallo-hydrolase n=1 Tax=Algoriphagus sp. A40 TaxID=1945863 RepID=UPI000986C25A|nr:MBL fold metallo-hydrolase [Algoriphagus sp. A40]OOG77110.1 MBL fold metallo-hydrolase [Algoriphagus sp. A40]